MQLVGIKGVWAMQDLSDCDYSGGEDEATVTVAAALARVQLQDEHVKHARLVAQQIPMTRTNKQTNKR